MADPSLNVLLITFDDLRPTLGCYGHPLARTPHIDRLAERSVRFDRSYCTNPLCNPSRVSMLTGLRPATTGVHTLKEHFTDTIPDAVTLPRLFREQGCFTARAGKVFHMGVPDTICVRGDGSDDPTAWVERENCPAFELNSTGPYYNATPWEREPSGAGGAVAWLRAQKTDHQQHDWHVAGQIVERIQSHADDAKPWFLAAGFARPHVPLVAPERFFQIYDDVPIDLPPGDPSQRSPVYDGWFGATFDVSEDDRCDAIRAYLACVSFVDEQVGRLLAALGASGQADRTLIVLTADHGYQLGEFGLWFKKFLYEPSARVPLLISSPAHRDTAGRGTARLVENIDLYPTVCELCGIDPPDQPHPLEGRSLVPLLDDPGGPDNWADVAFVETRGYGSFGTATITPRWKLNQWTGEHEHVELYDLENDPHELHDVAGDEANAATINELASLAGG